MRRDETGAMRVVTKIDLEGNSGRRRPKTMRIDGKENDLSIARVIGRDFGDRDQLKFRIKIADLI